MEIDEVEFPSQGATLRGRLYRPAAVRPPVVVMAHGFSATIDGMVADRYAEVFCGAGLAVLLYDHRNFGRSGGEPRQQIDRWLQVLGYRDAIGEVATRDDVDGTRIGLWGDSFGAACAIVAAAFDQRVKALIVQVPACGSSFPPTDPDGDLVESMARAYATPLLGPPDRIEGPMPVVSADQLNHPSALVPLTAFRWFIEYGGRWGTGWLNEVTRAVRSDLPWQPVLCAGRVRGAALFVIARADEMPGSNSAVARRAYELVPATKDLLEIEGGHFGLLHHPSPLFDFVSRAEAEFLRRVLRPLDGRGGVS